MPCTDADDYADLKQQLVHKDDVVVHKKDFDALKARLDEATRAACESLTTLGKLNKTPDLTKKTQAWWERHKRTDAARRDKEKREAKRLAEAFKAAAKAWNEADFEGATEILRKAVGR